MTYHPDDDALREALAESGHGSDMLSTTMVAIILALLGVMVWGAC